MPMRIWSGLCTAIVVGLTVGLVAQDPQPGPSQAAGAKTVTVSGCIQRSPAAPTGTSGSAASAMDTKFLLTNATMTPPAPASTPSTSTASQYRLDADEAKLSPHVGHKVEITGTITETAASATPPPAGASASAPAPAKLKVDNVKMVASTCP
jgi:hypothetical protein